MSGAVKAVGGAISGVFKAVTSVVKAVVNAVGSVVNMVLSPFMGLFGSPDVPDQSQAIKGVLVQQVGSNVRIPVIYGYRQVAGSVVFCETGASNNKYLWTAYVFAEGPIQAMQELFINDIQLSNTVVNQLNEGGVVAVNDGSKFAGRTTLQFFKGAYYADPASTGIGTAVKGDIFAGSPNFTTDMNFNGLAVLFARYEWKEATTQAEADNNPFSGSIPQVKVTLQGRKVASLTNTGFDSNNVPTGTSGIEAYSYGGSGYTESYSHNPAEILLDYLRNPRYGKGLSNAEIDWNSFYTAAYKCRTQVNYVVGSSLQGDALTLHYVLDTGSTIFNNVKLLLQNFRAYLPYNRGKFYLKIEDAGHPTDITSGVATIVKTFTKDNIFGDITYTGIDRTSKYNQVIVKYVDPDNKWSEQTVVYPATEAERQTFITADGGRENKGEFTFAGCTNYSIAYNHARIIFEKSRYQDSLSFTAGSEAFDLEPGDNIYLDANVLKFGTDPLADAIPWRVVTVKLNQDYTFEISCVRNPDSIYPHTRTGEKDYHIGIFVPDGASKKYPKEPLGVPVGLNPPAAGKLPDPPLNIGKLDDAVTIISSSYIVEDGLTYAVLEYYQPDTPQYYQTVFWWKVSNTAVTVWNRVEAPDRIEAGALLKKRIGPLLNNTPYEIRTRVQYNNGEYSNNLNKAGIRPTANGTEDPVDYVQTSYDGWSITTTPPLNSRNTRVASLTGATQTSGGAPLSPKKITVTGQEYFFDTMNQNVIGMKVYYKQSDADYWSERLYRFPATYVDGLGHFTFELDDIGVSSYPTLPGDEQYFDFIMRFAYADGTFSTQQVRGSRIATERNAAGLYSFNPFAAPASVQFNEYNVGQVILTEDMAPPGAVVNPLDIQFGLLDITASSYSATQYEMRFQVVLPDVSNRPDLYGARVYYRPVVQGQTPAYTVKDFLPLKPTGSSNDAQFYLRGLVQGQKYEFVVVALVNNSGTKAEANKSWFAIGTPLLGDISLLQPMHWQLVNTVDAKKELTSTFPITDPVPQVISWARVHTNSVAGSWQAPVTYYYQLKVQVPSSGFQELHIYRRSRRDVNYPAGTIAKYAGVGRWEKVVVTTSTHTFDANMQATINLRAPIDSSEFNNYYEIVAGQPLVNPTWGDALSPYLKPLDIESYAMSHEFLLVLKVSGTVSIVGSLLPRYNYSASEAARTGTRPLIEDITGGQLPPKVLLSDYATYDVGYNRNLTDARSSLAKNQVCMGSNRDSTFTYNSYGPTATPGVV